MLSTAAVAKFALEGKATADAHRDKGAEAVLEEVLELAKIVVRALACNALPEAPQCVHEHSNGHEDQERVPELVVPHQNEGPLHQHFQSEHMHKHSASAC